MAFCVACGGAIEDGASFCPRCGVPAGGQPPPKRGGWQTHPLLWLVALLFTLWVVFALINLAQDTDDPGTTTPTPTR
jgi:hypothetical protein